MRMVLAVLKSGLMSVLFIFCATAVSFSQTHNRNDPNRAVDKISSDLGVTEEQFVDCFWNVNPEKKGAPSGAKQRINKAILLPCLRKANPAINNDLLDDVMDRYRPEGPIRK